MQDRKCRLGIRGQRRLCKVTAIVNLSNPVSYEQAYIFLRSLEQGLFRMQISNLALAKDDNNGITVSALTLEVYTK